MTKTLLVPGLWLSASSWEDVLPTLVDAGLQPKALTMPGLGASGEAAAEIGMGAWIDAVVAEIEASDDDVVLVGHSGGGNVVWGAADRRSARVSRVIFVDTVPPAPGAELGDAKAEDGMVPFPGWESFPPEEVADLDTEQRHDATSFTSTIPEHVMSEGVTLSDPARFDIPVTLLMGSLDADGLEAELTNWGAFADEYRAIKDTEVVKIESGHWPQFSKPAELAQHIVRAVLR